MKKKVMLVLLSLLVLFVYVDLVPRFGAWLDRRLELLWRLPRWADPLAGAAIAVGYFLGLAFPGSGRAEATSGGESVLSRLRGRLIWGLWAIGAGIGLLLRSPSLMVMAAVVAVVVAVWIDRSDRRTHGADLEGRPGRRLARVPAWIILILIAFGTVAGFPRVSRSAPPQRVTVPGILVQIKCRPGTADLWRADFDEHLRPAIEEAVGRKDSFTGFEFMEPALPGQGFDFALLYTGASFSGLDQPRIFPQYLALAEREGPVRAIALSREMGQWEDHVTVSLVHLSRTR
jgi:hypothetical protein